MNLKELWIGETLTMLASGRIGRFEGIAKDGRARVACQGKVYLVKPNKLEIYVEPKIDKVKELTDELNTSPRTKLITNLKNEIDLHINVLNPKLSNGLPEHILSFQLAECKTFITQSVAARKHNISIIHGKGAGVLKSEVLELLKSFEEVSQTESINSGGAQRVYFRY